MPTTNRSRKNLIIVVIIIFAFILAVTLRVGYIQLVKGEEYRERALSQQTTDTEIDAERGTIYDRNGEKLAQSVKCYTVYAYPSEMGKYDKKKKQKRLQTEAAEKLAKALDRDEDELKKMLVGKSGQKTIGKGLSREAAAKVRALELQGVVISPSTKRSYPNGTLAANVMGLVNDDNVGQSGLELEYNNYLSGVAGRMVYYTDTNGEELSYSPENEKYFEAENGCDIISTIDLVIQSYTEAAIRKACKKTKADRVFAIVMNPKNGDVLAMAQTPTFNPNNPYVPASDSEKEKFRKMSQQEQSDYLSRMWRNPLICDVYEPGSVFKLLTASIALEEGAATMHSSFACGGAKNVSGTVIKCWNTAGHGTQTLKQAIGNSCNPALMTMALSIGIDKFYAYMDNYNISGTTGIDFPSEGSALLQDRDTAGPVGLATIGFGQGVAVTPIQLVNAINSFGNEGKLMKPRLVKGIKNKDTGEVEKIEPEVVRKTVSKETADEICEIMEYVVEEGGGGCAAVKGYRVGGKTGTANKAEKGKYSNYTDSSCLAMAPMSDPQLTVLVIADSPRTARFGSATAGPAVQEILGKSLRYLNIEPDKKESNNEGERIEIPSVVGKSADEAVGILSGAGLKYDMSDSDREENFMVLKQFPEAGMQVKKGTRVFIYD